MHDGHDDDAMCCGVMVELGVALVAMLVLFGVAVLVWA